MKFLIIYLLRSIGISLAIGFIFALSMHLIPIPGRTYSTDRRAIFLMVATAVLILQLITMPYLVYRNKSKGSKITAEDIHNEQMKLYDNVQAYFRRHRTVIIVSFIGLLIGLVLIDTFRTN